jgi:hypothetical protein
LRGGDEGKGVKQSQSPPPNLPPQGGGISGNPDAKHLWNSLIKGIYYNILKRGGSGEIRCGVILALFNTRYIRRKTQLQL